MRLMNLLNLPNPYSHTKPWGLHIIQQKWVPATEIMFLGCWAQPVCKADNITAICEVTLDNVGFSTSHNSVELAG
jgi:hypothetical protein